MSDRQNSADTAGTEVVYTSHSRAAEVASTPMAEQARQALTHAKRIVILTKFRFMGDTIVATPFFAQLRRHYPDADITLLAAPSVVTALAHCPHLDRILPVDMRGRSRWQHGKELHGMLRAGDYQAGFLLNRSLHCAVTCWAAHLPVRIGYINEFRRPFLTVPIPYFFDRNEVDCHLDMLRALGLPARDALPDLWMTEEEKARARQILRDHGWNGADPLIGVQPGANDAPIREWGAERFGQVAQTLADENSGQVVLMGGEAERATAERTAHSLRTPPIDLVGKLPLREALAAIGQCALWLSNDTGLHHAAVAQRVASVAMFGPNKVVRWGYDAPRHRSLVVFPDQPAQDDAAVRRCLDAITEESVLETARAVLRQTHEEHTTEELLSLPDAVATRPPYYAARLTAAQLVPARRR
jgi:heptosyltransferase-2